MADDDDASMINFIRHNELAKTSSQKIIIKRYESASQMRQWINSKKQELIGELEEKVKIEYFAEKMKKEKPPAPKVEEEKKEEDQPMQIEEEEKAPEFPPIEEHEALKDIDKSKDPELYEAIKASLVEQREKEIAAFKPANKPKKAEQIDSSLKDEVAAA